VATRDLTIAIQSKYDGKGTTAASEGLKATEEQSKRFEKALSDQEAQSKRSAQQLDAVGSSALRTRRLLEDATRRLPTIDVEADLSQPERQLADLTARLRELSDKRIGIDIDPRQVEQQVGEIRRQLMTLADDHPEVVVDANVERALTALEAVEREARKVDGRVAKIQVDVDGGPAVAAMALIDTALSALEAAGPAKVAAG
jgi:chromosome segregation ATPase